MKKASLEAYQTPFAEIIELSVENQFLQSDGDAGGDTPEIPYIED